MALKKIKYTVLYKKTYIDSFSELKYSTYFKVHQLFLKKFEV